MNNKVYKYIFSITIILVISLCISGCGSKKGTKVNNLEIKYEKGSTMELSKLDNGTVYTNNITVKNNSDKDITYSISWKNVNNSFQLQNKLLYDINTKDSDAGFLSKSQAPIADFTIFNKLIIKKGLTHKYTVSVYFEGDPVKEQNSSFKGTIEINEVKEQ